MLFYHVLDMFAIVCDTFPVDQSINVLLCDRIIGDWIHFTFM